MATTTPQSYGQICWLEIPVASASRAATFYSSVLGWECNNVEGTPSPGNQAKSVHMFNKGSLNGAFLLVHDEERVAKVTELTSPKQQVPVTTFHVESIEETIKKIEASGGKVNVPKTEIGGNMGFFARFIDSEGNLQGIWTQK